MKHFINQLSLISYLLCTSCCTPDDPLADCKTDPNCEYFECLVDGEKWVANCKSGPIFGCDPIDVQYYIKDGNFEIVIENSILNQGFNILVEDAIVVNKNYKIFSNTNLQSVFGNLDGAQCSIYFHDTLSESLFILEKLDTINFNFIANFSFKAKNSCGEIKSISAGKIKSKYRF